MKRILIILAIIPFITIAQPKKTSTTKPSLIESITSDTVNGQFNQVLFSYDESERVISITFKDVKIISDSTNPAKLVEVITKNQSFEYQGISVQPYLRTNHSYDYLKQSEKWILASIRKTYFLYSNGLRVGDSTLFLSNGDKKEAFKWEDSKASTNVFKLEQTNNRIYQESDYTNRSTGYPNVIFSEFKLSPQSNISYELYENRYGGRGIYGKYSTFTMFDSKLNPLKMLNISNALCNEKISFYLVKGDRVKEFNWYFFNQNNTLDYFVTFDEQSSPYKDQTSLQYTYNHYNQPVYVKVLIKQLWKNPGPDPNKVYGEYQKNFTFSYKK